MHADVLEDTGPPAVLPGAQAPGPPGRSLVYVPGIDGTGDLLLGTAAHLRRSFRLVRLGYVASDFTVASREGHRALARTVVDRLREIGLESPILLAESFGVSVALLAASMAPERIGRLALVNGFAFYPRRVRARLGRWLAPRIPGELFDAGRRAFGARTLFAPRRDPEVERAFFGLESGRFGPGYRLRLQMIPEIDLRAQLAGIATPTRVFASTHDRVVPSVRCGEELVARMPNASLERIERGGHVVLPFESERWCTRLERLAADSAP